MIIKEIINRRSIRSYTSEPVSDEQITETIKAAQFAPTANHHCAVEFVVVKGSNKNKVYEVLKKDFVKEAPVLIVPVLDKAKSVAPIQDLSIASENMMLQATAFGLGSVWKNLDETWAAEVKKILGIPTGHLIINLIPIGHIKTPTPAHTDAEFSEKKIHKEKW